MNLQPLDEHCERCRSEIQVAADVRTLVVRKAGVVPRSGIESLIEQLENLPPDDFDPAEALADLGRLRSHSEPPVASVPLATTRRASAATSKKQNALADMVAEFSAAPLSGNLACICVCGYHIDSQRNYCVDCGLASSNPASLWMRRRRKNLLVIHSGVAVLIAVPLIVQFGLSAAALGISTGIITIALALAFARATASPASRPFIGGDACYRHRERGLASTLGTTIRSLEKLREAHRTACTIRDGATRTIAVNLASAQVSDALRMRAETEASMMQIEIARLANAVEVRLSCLQQGGHTFESLSKLVDAAVATSERLKDFLLEEKTQRFTGHPCGRSALAMGSELVSALSFLSDQAAMAKLVSAGTVMLPASGSTRDEALASWRSRIGDDLERLSASIAAGVFDAQILAVKDAEHARLAAMLADD